MLNYIGADIRRILTRIPRAIFMAVIYAVLVAIVITSRESGEFDSVAFVMTFGTFASVMPLAIGIVELVSIFSADFKAKTMQSAIGNGISRRHVVLSKLLEVIAILLIDMLLLAAIGFLMSGISSIHLTQEQTLEIFARLFSVWLRCCCLMSITMIIMFYSQGTGIAVIFYLLCAAGLLKKLFEVVLSIDFLKKLHLASFLPSSLADTFQTRMILGSFSVERFIGIALYMIAAYFVTVFLFKRRELEF